MQRYYIKLKKNTSMPLLTALTKHLKISQEEATYLINIGSVWDAETKLRIKDTRLILTDQHQLKIDKPKKPVNFYPLEEKDIRYQDNDYLIVFKKFGFPTIGTPYADACSLNLAVTKYLQQKDTQLEALVINRLDLPTRGLVFFAKNKSMETKLHNMFKDREIKKYYLVQTEKMQEVKQTYICEDILEWGGKSKSAKTHIRFLKHTDKFSYFLASPKTGRTHQIRKHFANYIKPIYGDSRYGNYSSSSTLGLLCYGYRFKDPTTKKPVKIKYIPADFFFA